MDETHLARFWERVACARAASHVAPNTTELMLATRLGGMERLQTVFRTQQRLLEPR
jgi:hypothetical protein